MKKSNLSLILVFRLQVTLLAIPVLISGFQCHAQSSQNEVSMVNLDKDNDMTLEGNTKIVSQFSNLPLVEPTIAAHPSDENILAAAAMVVTDVNKPYQSCRLSSFISLDGGKKWEETAHDYWGYDPWIAMSENGKTIMSWLGTPGNFQHSFPLNVFTSNNGGVSWLPKVQLFKGKGHGHDGTKLVGLKKTFYLTTVRFNANMGADVVLYESNGGPFNEVGVISGEGKRLNFCEPAILTNGHVVVPSLHYNGKVWAHIYNPKDKSISKAHEVSQNPKVGRGYARMAADTGLNSAFKDNVYFVRAVADGKSSKGVWLNTSTNGGRSWSIEKRIDLFENPRQSKANVASIAVNKNGVIGISWVDAQHDTGQLAYDVYFTISKDGGKSFQRPLRVTPVSSNPRTTKNADVANKFIGGGHYLGLTSRADNNFQLLWSDSRQGFFQLQTATIKIKQRELDVE
ncbi:hypothetical protein [Flagellimonas flava]|uniref:BNR repeat-like domain-containing protein n=1 Tax=Flagellimonas flava TaxID=570519 RepID=A0A1M5JZC8_9FLAO|nr:hypothetical protein [Allomuricauda flava]SHG45599.1 hypothetical protein SAMN04488116_1289 [Allomuricauda flava]